jgi:uncharacterized protein (DUF433 family)
MVSVVIDNLAAGESHESIIQGYNIKADDIQAALRYAAEFDTETMAGHLWIVDEHQVRIRPGDPPASP